MNFLDKNENNNLQYDFFNISSYISDNEKYNRSEDFEKLTLIDAFYDELFLDEKLKIITISATENRKETSQLLEDIFEDDRFRKLDLIQIAPNNQNYYVPFEDIVKQIEEQILSEKEQELNEEKLMKIILPLQVIVEMGLLDTQMQKDKLGIYLRNLETKIAVSNNFENSNMLNNKLTKIIDDISYWREESIHSKEGKIIEIALIDNNYANKFQLEILNGFKTTIMSSQQEEFNKYVQIIVENKCHEKDNQLIKLLNIEDRFVKELEKQEQKIKNKNSTKKIKP